MVEILTPTSSPLNYQVQALHLDWAVERLRIWVKSPSGLVEGHAYSGETALTLMKQLNTANLSTTSLHRRILERLMADGKLPAGSISGVPD